MIETLHLSGFRNLVPGQVQFEPGLNIVWGENGQGKTNLLEALFLLLAGKSFRTHSLSHCLQEGQVGFSLTAKVNQADQRHERGLTYEKKICQRQIFGEKVSAFEYLKGTCVFSFTARDKLLVEGPPDERRRFMDRLVFSFEPGHFRDLTALHKMLQHLKGSLYSGQNQRMYRAFKQPFCDVSERIIQRRMFWMRKIWPAARQLANQLFDLDLNLDFEYRIRSAPSIDGYRQKMDRLNSQELLQKRVLMGPHLDDFEMNLNGKNAKQTASSGQIRAFVLSLQCAAINLFHQEFGYFPVFLFDDFDSEIDVLKLHGFLEYLQSRGQTVLSTSKHAIIPPEMDASTFYVRQGAVFKKGTLNDRPEQ